MTRIDKCLQALCIQLHIIAMSKIDKILFTCVSVNFNSALNSALSEIDKYCFSLYFFSRALSWAVVKGVRGFRFGLCFLNMHRTGPGGARSVISNYFWSD